MGGFVLVLYRTLSGIDVRKSESCETRTSMIVQNASQSGIQIVYELQYKNHFPNANLNLV